jgi:hypothetical protein
MKSKYATELKLWCVLCTPVKTKSDEQIKKELGFLLRGPGKADIKEGEISEENMRAMMWTALAMTGIGENREAHYATQKQRLLIFRTRRSAEKYARKEGSKNKMWTFKAQPVRLANPDECDVREYEHEINEAGTWWVSPFNAGYGSIHGKVMTPTEGADSAREEVVGVAATDPINEAKRIVEAHNAEISRLVAKFTVKSG